MKPQEILIDIFLVFTFMQCAVCPFMLTPAKTLHLYDKGCLIVRLKCALVK